MLSTGPACASIGRRSRQPAGSSAGPPAPQPTDEEAAAGAVGQRLLVALAGVHHALQLQRRQAGHQLVVGLQARARGRAAG